LIKQLTKAAMQAELKEHLATKKNTNRKNGAISKSMKTPAGGFEVTSMNVIPWRLMTNNGPHYCPGILNLANSRMRVDPTVGWMVTIGNDPGVRWYQSQVLPGIECLPYHLGIQRVLNS
jgi:hypothetical protein